MPCQDALIKFPVCIKADVSVEIALDILHSHGLRKMPVVDDAGHLVGMLGLCTILNELLPISARMEDGLPTLDFIKGSGIGVAKRLLKIKKKSVRDVMVPVAEMQTVRPDTPIWEAIRVIIKQGSPLAVMEETSGNFCGLVSEQSILANLETLIDEMEKTPDVYFR